MSFFEGTPLVFEIITLHTFVFETAQKVLQLLAVRPYRSSVRTHVLHARLSQPWQRAHRLLRRCQQLSASCGGAKAHLERVRGAWRVSGQHEADRRQQQAERPRRVVQAAH